MKMKILIAALGGIAAIPVAAAYPDPPPGYFTHTTDKGCVFFDWQRPENELYHRTTAIWTWSGSCEKGQTISGRGTLTWEEPSRRSGNLWYRGTETGQLVAGYRDGDWSSTMTPWGGSDEPQSPWTYRLGCATWDGQIIESTCTPASGQQIEIVSAGAKGDGADHPASEETTDEKDEPAEAPPDSEPGGPDHVTESGEGGRETDRFIAARVSRERAPKHNKAHDRSECLGKYLEEHRPPHNHYVLYNKCDTPINVVWCVMGTGHDCEAGSGSIANMEPRVGYIAGMEDSPGMKAGACSGKVWPIMENGQMAGYGCE